MNITELYSTLIDHGVDINTICFNDNIKDNVFCIIENYNHYDVAYRERGILFDYQSCQTLEEVLDYLLERLSPRHNNGSSDTF